MDKSGRTLSGQTTEAFLVSVSHAKPMWLVTFQNYSLNKHITPASLDFVLESLMFVFN